MNEDRILDAIAALSHSVTSGFGRINTNIDGLCSRIQALEGQLAEQKEKTLESESKLEAQGAAIESLEKIVYDLARNRPARKIAGGTAILREDAYPEFERSGYTPRAAMKALRKSGAVRGRIEPATGKDRNTIVVRIGGTPTRVIVVAPREK